MHLADELGPDDPSRVLAASVTGDETKIVAASRFLYAKTHGTKPGE